MVKQANNLEIHSFLKYFEDYIDRAKQDSEQKPLDAKFYFSDWKAFPVVENGT